jgi:hypothetical protein
MRPAFVASALKSALYCEPARHVYRLLKYHVFAVFRYSARDAQVLIEYYYWLEDYQSQKDVVLDQAPLVKLSQSFASAEKIDAAIFGRIRRIARFFLWPLRLAVRQLRKLRRFILRRVYSPQALEQPTGGLSIATSLRARLVGSFQSVRGAFRAILNVHFLHQHARQTAFQLLLNNGDLEGATEAFERLSKLESAPNPADKALDLLMTRLLPQVAMIERQIAQIDRPADKRGSALVMSLVVWGDAYLDLFERFLLPSLMADGNLPAVAETVTVTWHIFATKQDRLRLAQNPMFKRVQALSQVRFEEIPSEVVALANGNNCYWLYGALTQTSIRLAQRMRADIHFVNPDTVYSRDFFTALYRLAARSRCILSNSFRTNRDSVCAALEAYRAEDGIIALCAGDLQSLGLQHMHQASRRVVVTADELKGEYLPRSTLLMWFEPGALVLHTAHYHPMFISSKLLTSVMRLSYFTVDSSFIRLSGIADDPNCEICVAGVEDEIGYFEISPSEIRSPATVPVGYLTNVFWSTNTDYEFGLLQKDLRLPVSQLPTGLPVSQPRVMMEAFHSLINKFAAARPTSMAPSRTVTINALVRLSDVILKAELQGGSRRDVESKIEQLALLTKRDVVAYFGAELERSSLRQLLINFLRLGLLGELVSLRDRLQLPFDSNLCSFIDFCVQRYRSAAEDGRAWRAQHVDEELFLLSCIVWGSEYIENFLEFNVRSMLAPENLPGLAREGRCKIFVITNAAGRKQIERHPVFADATRILDWEFSTVPDGLIDILVQSHLKDYFYLLYGMLDHVGVLHAQGAGAHLFMIPVDSVVANGSLTNMAKYREQGYECCGGGNIVAESETFLPRLRERFAKQSAIAISARELGSLAIAHPHHYFVSQIICRENENFGRHPRELFWPVPGGIMIHSCFIHPLFCSASAVQRYKRLHLANVDYGMIPRIFEDSCRIKVLTDPSEAYINNFASGSRLYETTGRPFHYDDFIAAHDHTYPVQKSLFIHGQSLPCEYAKLTAYRDVATDVAELSELLNPQDSIVRQRVAAAS